MTFRQGPEFHLVKVPKKFLSKQSADQILVILVNNGEQAIFYVNTYYHIRSFQEIL